MNEEIDRKIKELLEMLTDITRSDEQVASIHTRLRLLKDLRD